MKVTENIAVLFVEKNTIYKKMGLDCWDEDRDALNYVGRSANIYHPPCRLWSKMRYFSNADDLEKYLALWSVNKVRSFGGVLEHPAYSGLWKMMNLPSPGKIDDWGGFTIELNQFDFGHLAEKKTWLYIVGIKPDDELLKYKRVPAKVKYTVSSSKREYRTKKELPKHKRSSTPKRFAKFLVKIVTKINNSKLN